tara:strand:+ start:18551 stop:19672 length:1122 start_codon:yes stop_codon:yes gene_type:complete
MKILFPLLAYYPSQVGGPANTVYWLVKELSKKNKVTVITTNLGIKKNITDTNRSINSEYGTVYYGKKTLIDFLTIIKAVKEVKNNDIIHINGLFDVIGIIPLFFGLIFYPSKSYVCSVRGGLSKSALEYSSLRKKILLYIFIYFKKNIHFHATSLIEEQQIKNHISTDKIFMIPNYISPEKRYENKIDKKQFIFLGRIHPIKCIENIIEAIIISKSFIKNNFSFIIVGAYEKRFNWYFEKLKSTIRENNLEKDIKFTGHIEGHEKQILLAESHALILSSSSENFGNVVLESLNQGTPVIASKGTPWEILESSNCGFHVLNSPQEISNSIEKLIDMPIEEYYKIRKNSIKLVIDKFDIASNINNWIENYNSILK